MNTEQVKVSLGQDVEFWVAGVGTVLKVKVVSLGPTGVTLALSADDGAKRVLSPAPSVRGAPPAPEVAVATRKRRGTRLNAPQYGCHGADDE